jgi:hypothetical protein
MEKGNLIMEQTSINHLAVVAAALSDFIVGALWYSPALFYRAWKTENRFTDEMLKAGFNPALVYGLTFLFALVISYNLAFFLAGPGTDGAWGATAGLLAGLGWASLGFATVALFERRSVRYVLINCGYLTAAFTLKGFIIGSWR